MNKFLSGRRLLVVEDEMLVLLMIEDMLADLGCEAITAAATVVQALALIDTQRFDVAMVDMNLNGTTTYSVADLLAARGVPFVFSTGYRDHAMEDGYRDRPVLKKPFMEQDLAEALTRLLPR
jgi:CheY-like chemotaxis protein